MNIDQINERNERTFNSQLARVPNVDDLRLAIVSDLRIRRFVTALANGDSTACRISFYALLFIFDVDISDLSYGLLNFIYNLRGDNWN